MPHFTLREIIKSRDKCANIIAQYGPTYLPIFERLQREVYKSRKQDNLYKVAMKISKGCENPDSNYYTN